MRIGFPALALTLFGTVVMAQSPYESAADFAKYARKLREQALLKVEPQVFVPTASRTSTATRYPWKTNIVTTMFWLPYNDVTHGQFKPEAPLVIPWYRTAYTEPGHSVCKDRWLAIRKGNRVCYAQWEDCGPFRTDHFQYVFQNERPKPNLNHGAGLDVSPAVRDYLGLGPTDVTDWQFVEIRDIPPGPWRSYGDNNHFVIAKRQAEARLVQQSNGTTR